MINTAKKGQAALEFLTTYGWAFLVILVMIGALGYFGVLNPSNLLPESCIATPGFTCEEFRVMQHRDGGGDISGRRSFLNLNLVNQGSEPIEIDVNDPAATYFEYNGQNTSVNACTRFNGASYVFTSLAWGIDSHDAAPYTWMPQETLQIVCRTDDGTMLDSDTRHSLLFRVPYTPVGGNFERTLEVELFVEAE